MFGIELALIMRDGADGVRPMLHRASFVARGACCARRIAILLLILRALGPIELILLGRQVTHFEIFTNHSKTLLICCE